MPSRDLASRDMHRIVLGAETIDYALVRRRGRRGIGLRVDGQGLTVNAPLTVPLPSIEALVRQSERWVLRKIAQWSARRIPEQQWDDGAALRFLGAPLTLRLREGARGQVSQVDGELVVRSPSFDATVIRRGVTLWYKRAARAYLGERLEALASSAGLAIPRLTISPALSRWGSCNSRREVRLAWRLVKAPPALIDYVICHELAHLRHMNHSPAFWAEVARLCPDYKGLRAELVATDHLYRTF